MANTRRVRTVRSDRSAFDRDGSAVGAASTADTRCAVSSGSRDCAAGDRDRTAVGFGCVSFCVCTGADARAATDGFRGHSTAFNIDRPAVDVRAAANRRAAVGREIAVLILRANSARPGIDRAALNGHGEVGSTIAAADASAKCAPGLNMCAVPDRHRASRAAVLAAADPRAVLADRVSNRRAGFNDDRCCAGGFPAAGADARACV